MKPAHICTDAELEYAIADINAAISANPETSNLVRYLQDRSACKRELQDRERRRSWRNRLHSHLFDPLTVPIRGRKWMREYRNSSYARCAWRDAAWFLAVEAR